MKENRKRLEARLTEENEIYVKERRKYFERDMDRYHDCIFDFVESMGEAINEISKEVLDVFGVQAEEFDRSVAAHFRDIEVQKMHKQVKPKSKITQIPSKLNQDLTLRLLTTKRDYWTDRTEGYAEDENIDRLIALTEVHDQMHALYGIEEAELDLAVKKYSSDPNIKNLAEDCKELYG